MKEDKWGFSPKGIKWDEPEKTTKTKKTITKKTTETKKKTAKKK